MAKENWAEAAMYERRHQLREKQKRGDAKAGRKLLSTALEALAKAIDGNPLNIAELETLDYLRTGLHDHLINEIPLDTAFGISQPQGGQPERPEYTRQELYAEVCQLARRFKKEGHEQPITAAKNEVGKRHGLSGKRVGAICGRIVITDVDEH